MQINMKNLRTNSKEVKAKIQQYITDCIEVRPEEYDNLIINDFKDELIFVLSEFKRVACFENNIKRCKTYQAAFIDWFQGLPSYFNISVYNDEIVNKLMPSFGLPLPTKKTEQQGIELFYALIFSNFCDLCKKNGLNAYEYFNY